MKTQISLLLLIVFISCKNDHKNKVIPKKSKNFELISQPDKVKNIKPSNNSNLIDFLEKPIDLKEFKELTINKKNYITTGVCNSKDYYFLPKIKDSIFYIYNYLNGSLTNSERINQIIVFKHGNNKHLYDDENEILIELRIFNNDTSLEEGNLVGLTKSELETKFGTNYLIINKRIVYSYKNKVLIIELNQSKVKSYNYVFLNTEKIDIDLIKKILNYKN